MHTLNKVKWGVIPICNYKGILVTKTREGYSVLGQNVRTPEEVDGVIKVAGKHLQNSIHREEDFHHTEQSI